MGRLASVEALAPVDPVVLGGLGPSVQRPPQELRFAVAQALAGILLPAPLFDLGRVDVALAGSAAGCFGIPSNFVHVGLVLAVCGYSAPKQVRKGLLAKLTTADITNGIVQSRIEPRATDRWPGAQEKAQKRVTVEGSKRSRRQTVSTTYPAREPRE